MIEARDCLCGDPITADDMNPMAGVIAHRERDPHRSWSERIYGPPFPDATAEAGRVDLSRVYPGASHQVTVGPMTLERLAAFGFAR